MRVEPKPWRGKWVVDLRAQGLGSRYVLGDDTLPREEAIHLAYAALHTLRGTRLAEASTERDLFGEKRPSLVAGAIDAWQAAKRYDTDGGKEWGDKYTRLLRREIGDYALDEFSPPAGTARLAGYVDELRRREMSGRTIRNRIFLARQVFAFAVDRGWLPTAPSLPRMPPKPAPEFQWYSEAMFRALRAEIFPLQFMPGHKVTDGETIARRRVYLSWLFYTGSHTIDADRLVSDHLFLDGRSYIRHNTKSAACVRVVVEQYEMPEPLYADLRELQNLLGRPFLPGEALAGGPWPHVARVMGAAARRLKLPHCNPRILRRSYAREMFLHGYTVREVVDRMGHSDERMLKEIYARTPHAAGRISTKWTTPAPNGAPVSGSGMATVHRLGKS